MRFYCDREKLNQIADRHGISKQAMSKKIKRIRESLQLLLNEKECDDFRESRYG